MRAGCGCRNNTNSSKRPEAVGWAPSVLAGPLATSLRGLWVSGLLPPGNGGTNGGDPKTDQVAKGADSELPGWHPKEKSAQLPQKRGLSNQCGWRQYQKGTECAKGRRPKNPGVAAPLTSATCSGRFHLDGARSLPRRGVHMTSSFKHRRQIRIYGGERCRIEVSSGRHLWEVDLRRFSSQGFALTSQRKWSYFANSSDKLNTPWPGGSCCLRHLCDDGCDARYWSIVATL